ncbi:antirestriction protein [Vibrio sp. WXL103]|uniref:antirestriction protein n=1 Tax=Vibrio sp. WXL103 TaxID=3450710 RepID=UPI003EC63CD2
MITSTYLPLSRADEFSASYCDSRFEQFCSTVSQQIAYSVTEPKRTWLWVELSNGGRYLQPACHNDFVTLWHPKHRTPVRMSLNAAGVCFSLLALERLAYDAYKQQDLAKVDEIAIEHNLLEKFAQEHSESDLMAAIYN